MTSDRTKGAQVTIEDNRALALAWLEMRGELRDEDALALMADDATHWVPPSLAPKVARGKEELRELWSPVLHAFEGPFEVTILGTTAEGNRVAVEVEARGTLKNGRLYHNFYHHLFVIEDGKVQSLREHMDSQYTAQTLLPFFEEVAGSAAAPSSA